MMPRTRMGRFDRGELAKLIHRLRGVCIDCGIENCESTFNCGVWTALATLDLYMSNERMLLEESNLERHRPEGADPCQQELAVCTATLAQLCGCCMFHKPNCVINRVFSALEDARELRFRKPMARRPAEFIFG